VCSSDLEQAAATMSRVAAHAIAMYL